MILSLLVADVIAAQAGGGGSYGGGGSRGGGGGSGDGIFFLVRILLELCVRQPVIGIPLTILVIAIFIYVSSQSRRGLQNRSIRRGRGARAAAFTVASTAGLSRVDPDFDVDRFLGRVRKAFRTAQDSWCQQELEPLRSFVSDGIYERFSLQIEEQRRDGWYQAMAGLTIQSMSVIHYGSDVHFDTLTVRIPFTARIYRKARGTDKEIPASALPGRQFVECWSFLRRRGARTRQDEDGVFGGRCPNCGETLEIQQAGTCGSCASLIRNGEYDWVLAEITQAVEWKSEDSSNVPGLVAKQKVDPDLNAQHLEDRASVVFWRKVAADRDADVKPLVKVATPEFGAALAAEFERDDKHSYLGDCAVGSVKTLGILPGAEWDRAVLEVRWDGVRVTRRTGSDGESHDHKSRERTSRVSVMVLQRKASARTDIGHALSSSHCSSCGAPDTGGTSATCDYCGAPQNDGDAEWLLVTFEPRIMARSLLAEIADLPATIAVQPRPPATIEALEWLLACAMQDGELDDEERAVLQAATEKWGVPSARLESLLAHDADHDRAEPRSNREAIAWIEHIIDVALQDGHLSKTERKLISRASIRSGCSLADSKRMIQRTRTRLAKQSRTARKSVR